MYLCADNWIFYLLQRKWEKTYNKNEELSCFKILTESIRCKLSTWILAVPLEAFCADWLGIFISSCFSANSSSSAKLSEADSCSKKAKIWSTNLYSFQENVNTCNRTLTIKLIFFSSKFQLWNKLLLSILSILHPLRPLVLNHSLKGFA